jgi:hypothetical protein
MKTYSPTTLKHLIEQQEENEQEINEQSLSLISQDNYKIKILPFDIQTNSIVSMNRIPNL